MSSARDQLVGPSLLLALLGCGGPQNDGTVVVDVGAPQPPARASATALGTARPAVGPGEYEIYPGVVVPEAWVDCSTEDDCAIVEAGCCDHCNGGGITTVNRAFAAEARKKLEKVGCDSACTKKDCDAATAHHLVCMTRACHFDDLEPEVEERLWGGRDASSEADRSVNVIEAP